MKNDLSLYISVEDATELALDRPLWRLLAVSGAMHWNDASRTMMMMPKNFFFTPKFLLPQLRLVTCLVGLERYRHWVIGYWAIFAYIG